MLKYFAIILCVQIIDLSLSENPNIIIIVADDLGWNDVGFHSSNQIPTPNIDILAYSGIILKNYYTMPLCTPSRSALMTGRHPIHTGMQEHVIRPPEPWGLGLEEKIMPEYLKEQGYNTHGIGKWHLGFFKNEYAPTKRGFDSFYGYWGGHADYFDHTLFYEPYIGYDLRDDMDVATGVMNEYATRLFTRKAEEIILNHNKSNPLFLYVAHLAVHTGNENKTLQAPQETIDLFQNITDYDRRVFAAMVYELDLSVGTIIKALGDSDLLQNSIIVFSTDNGGRTNVHNGSASTNWPIRGGKHSVWEGGMRGVSLLWSPLLMSSGYVSNELSHLQDWLPTIMNAINASDALIGQNLDGINLWDAFNNPSIVNNSREDLLLVIRDSVRQFALRYNQWKLLSGSVFNGTEDEIYLPDGRDGEYNFTALYASDTYNTLQLISNISIPNYDDIIRLRNEATISCSKMNVTSSCKPLEEICLFNIEEDPCEVENVAASNPDIVNFMIQLLNNYNSTAMLPRNQPEDPNSNPIYWNNTWTNWMDYPLPLIK